MAGNGFVKRQTSSVRPPPPPAPRPRRPELGRNQKIALKYYKAYSALCHSVDEDIPEEDQNTLRVHRKELFAIYKFYDPDNSFDIAEAVRDD